MFSIIIPLFNKAPYIQRAIDSVLNQSFKKYEIIVINDGSTDGGGELVEKLYGDKVKLIHQENKGVSVARNTGISEANYPYVAFLDADDCWHPDFLWWMTQVIEKYPEAGILGSTYSNQLPLNIPDHPEILEIEDYFKKADYNTLYTSSSTVIRKDFFKHNEGFKNHIIKGEDLDVWFRAIAWYGKCYYVKAPLLYYDLSASLGTIQLPDLEKTNLPELLSDLFLPQEAPHWSVFRDKFTLLNLWLYFEKKNTWKSRSNYLKKLDKSYFMAKVLYVLPYSFWEIVHASSFLKSRIRKYLKFCFRYIYK